MKLRLGKKEHKPDPKTLHLSAVISPHVDAPARFDFDHGRTSFPRSPWGNLEWGDCVKASQANGLLRLERLETHRTPKVTEQDVVEAYKRQTGSQTPGDDNDNGLVMLDNNRLWRTEGFPVKSRSYKIAAFGELDPSDTAQLRAAVYLLHGIHFGLSLPTGLHSLLYERAVWDVPATANGNPAWRPGTWGGHAVFCKAYDEKFFEIMTWGMKVFVTDAFVRRYCDEVWAVVDNFDNWRKRPEINVDAMIQHLRDIGASGIQ